MHNEFVMACIKENMRISKILVGTSLLQSFSYTCELRSAVSRAQSIVNRLLNYYYNYSNELHRTKRDVDEISKTTPQTLAPLKIKPAQGSKE